MQPEDAPVESATDRLISSASMPASLEAPTPAASPRTVRRKQVGLYPEAFLRPWASQFKHTTMQWGLITDVREDGSTYQRHGIIVELFADINKAVNEASDDEESDDEEAMFLWRLRYAVDVVKLILAVDPSAAKFLLFRRRMQSKFADEDDKEDPNISEEEFDQLVKGEAPFEVRLQVDVSTKHFIETHQHFVDEFMEGVDQEEVGEDFVDDNPLRSYLLDHVLQRSDTRRLASVPVRAVVCVTSHERSTEDRLFESVASMSEELKSYQDRRDATWDIATHLAPLVVEKIDLRLSAVPLKAAVLKNASAFVENGLPVVCSRVTLLVRSIECEESDLQVFLNAFTDAGKSIDIHTGRVLGSNGPGDDNEDISSKIIMLLRCIGRLECDVSLDLSGLVSSSCAAVNWQAMIRGFVEFILSRSVPLKLALVATVVLTDEDTIDLQQEVSRWRRDHQGQQLRLQSVYLRPEMGCFDLIRGIVAILDDVENFTLDSIDEFDFIDDIKAMLRFPSLRSLVIKNANIPSMDLFACSMGSDPVLRLERLELGGLTLADSASMVEFVRSLDPNSNVASSLSGTLRRLVIAETDGTVFWENAEDYEDIRMPLVRLAVNDSTAVEALHEVLTVNRTLRYVNFVGDFENSLPVMPVSDENYAATTSLIPAAPAAHRAPLEKARKAAFLSAIQQGSCNSSRGLDSNLIRIIVSFDALKTVREIRV